MVANNGSNRRHKTGFWSKNTYLQSQRRFPSKIASNGISHWIAKHIIKQLVKAEHREPSIYFGHFCIWISRHLACRQARPLMGFKCISAVWLIPIAKVIFPYCDDGKVLHCWRMRINYAANVRVQSSKREGKYKIQSEPTTVQPLLCVVSRQQYENAGDAEEMQRRTKSITACVSSAQLCYSLRTSARFVSKWKYG